MHFWWFFANASVRCRFQLPVSLRVDKFAWSLFVKPFNNCVNNWNTVWAKMHALWVSISTTGLMNVFPSLGKRELGLFAKHGSKPWQVDAVDRQFLDQIQTDPWLWAGSTPRHSRHLIFVRRSIGKSTCDQLSFVSKTTHISSKIDNRDSLLIRNWHENEANFTDKWLHNLGPHFIPGDHAFKISVCVDGREISVGRDTVVEFKNWPNECPALRNKWKLFSSFFCCVRVCVLLGLSSFFIHTHTGLGLKA